jgi:ParB family transcriptional regulator, chromosome partitioning protein
MKRTKKTQPELTWKKMDKRSGLGKGLSALFTEKNVDVENISSTGEEIRGTRFIEIEKIETNPEQPRTDFDEESLKELSDSIKEKGLIQPVTVKPNKEMTGYILISGERRLRACKLAGIEKIKAVFYDREIESEEDLLELALIENIQRKDLNAMELSDSFWRLAEDFNLTQEQIAEKVYKKRSTVANFIRLQKLPQQIKDSLRKNDISEAHARMLLRIEDHEDQITLWKRILNENISVRNLEEITKPGIKQRKKKVSSLNYTDPYLKDLEDKLRKHFGTKVSIKSKTKYSGEIIIEYFSNDDLERISDICEE